MSNPISRQDIRLFVYLPVFALIAWTMPQTKWDGLAVWLAGLPQPIAPIRIRRDARKQPRRMPPGDRAAQRIMRYFQYLRELRPGGWHSGIIIENEQVAAGNLATGKGVVFWIANTRSADLVAKKALYRIGVELHHLSRPEHGGSHSLFGKKFLNAISRVAENRFLTERVIITSGQEFRATKQLKMFLSQGKAVSITASAEGRQTRLVRAFGGVFPLATGAPALAHATGAALVPVFCVQLATKKPTFRVAFGPEISVQTAKTRQAEIDFATMEFAAMHERFLSGYEIQWRGFGHMIASCEPDAAAAQ